MNHSPKLTLRSVPFVLATLLLPLSMLGCREEQSARSARPAGAGTAVSASEKDKKVKELDDAIVQMRANANVPPAEKEAAIAAMERGKASLQAKAN